MGKYSTTVEIDVMKNQPWKIVAVTEPPVPREEIMQRRVIVLDVEDKQSSGEFIVYPADHSEPMQFHYANAETKAAYLSSIRVVD